MVDKRDMHVARKGYGTKSRLRFVSAYELAVERVISCGAGTGGLSLLVVMVMSVLLMLLRMMRICRSSLCLLTMTGWMDRREELD